MAKTNQVALVQVASSDYENAYRRALSLLSSIPTFPRGQPVILKPNFVAPRKDCTAAITDLKLVKVVAQTVKESGSYPVILETPGMEYVSQEVFDFLHIKEFAESCDIAICSGIENLVKVKIVGGKGLGSIKVAKILTEAPIINIPKFKAHPLTKLSFGMKNLMGALPPQERINMHVHGIHQSIVDINKVIKPVLTVVDANSAMQGDSVYGDRIDLGLLIVGTNTLAVDIACCRIVGVPPEHVTHIKLAMAESDDANIELVGDVPKENFKFILPQKGTMYRFASRLMYVADVPFRPVFGMPFNRYLYRSGFFGTRPQIKRKRCTGCGKCINICMVEGAITLDPPHIDYKKCIRCLECLDVCQEKALQVKGLTKPSKSV